VVCVAPFTYFSWRKKFGGLKGDEFKRLQYLEENERLRKAVSDLTSAAIGFSSRVGSVGPASSRLRVDVTSIRSSPVGTSTWSVVWVCHPHLLHRSSSEL
jgi:hypothetical protein